MSAARIFLLMAAVGFVYWLGVSIIRRYGWLDLLSFTFIGLSATFLVGSGLYCLGGGRHG